MKKTIVICLAFVAIGFFMSFDITSSNGIAGRTGSPGETACNVSGCHSGNPLNDVGGSITLSAPTLTGFQYVLGQTYAISVTISRPGVSLYGFGFEALTTAGANAGTLLITDAVTTTTKNATIAGNSRKSVVHKLNGGATANTHTFTFNWMAPATNVGNVTFYFAGNAANGNGLTSGDFIYKASQVVTPAPVGIAEKNTPNFSLSVFPNPASESATISYILPADSKVTAKLVSLTGQVVEAFYTENQIAGKQEQKLELNPTLSNGIYLISLEVNGAQSFKKLIIN
jgi:hypothetical protein